MEEWGTIITTITTILPFPTTKGRLGGHFRLLRLREGNFLLS